MTALMSTATIIILYGLFAIVTPQKPMIAANDRVMTAVMIAALWAAPINEPVAHQVITVAWLYLINADAIGELIDAIH